MRSKLKNFKFVKNHEKNTKERYWFIWKGLMSFIGYKCIKLKVCCSFNDIYITIQYHRFGLEYKTLEDIENDIINENQNIVSTKIKKNDYIFRMMNDHEDNDYIDILLENDLHFQLSKISKYVFLPFQIFFNPETQKCCSLLPYKYNLVNYINNILKPMTKKINFLQKLYSRYENMTIKNFNKITKIQNKIIYLNTRIELYILKIFLKVIDMIESLYSFKFRHGDLKLNNILCDKTKDINNLNIYMIDFGNSSFIYDNEKFETIYFKEYIGRSNYNYDDISFFFLHTYILRKYWFNNSHIENIVSKIVKSLYKEKFEDLSKITDDSWGLYYNDIILFKYKKKYKDIIKLYNIKFSLIDDYKDIINDRISEILN
jgi:hypothetical protein